MHPDHSDLALGPEDSKLEYGAAGLSLGITKALGEFIAAARFSNLGSAAIHEGKRGLLDWLGCAMAGANHPVVSKLLTTFADLGTGQDAIVLCRDIKLGSLEAAIVNGQMGHVLDFDDTHMGGVVLHASSPILSAVFSLAQRQTVGGKDLLLAYALGFEAGVRVGASAPGHRKGGWHLTGTLGTFAAAAAVGRLLNLDAKQQTYALGIAGTQAAGMQQNRGTDCKSFHSGRAASNGLLAAFLAKNGFDSSDEIIEGKRGFARIYSDVATPESMLKDIGNHWEITSNGYKPYACGVLLHPAIDAVINVSREASIDPDEVDTIDVVVHPNAVRITGLANPKTGLQSKFSIVHTAAVAYIDRAAGIAQYADDRAGAQDVRKLAPKISVAADKTLGEDQAYASVTSRGRRHESRVEHASGTTGNPMSDQAIEAKFLDNAVPAIGLDRARAICDIVWKLEEVADLRDILGLCAQRKRDV